MELKDFIKIRQDLKNERLEDFHIVGDIINLSKEQISLLQNLEESIYEIKDKAGKIYGCEQLDQLLYNDISVELASGEFPNYFESFSELIEKHPYSFDLSDFYIHQGNITKYEDDHALMNSYRNVLELIAFLKKIADNKNETASGLELYFHKIGESLILPISYTVKDLNKSTVEDVQNFIKQFSNELHSEDRKKLFVNDLVDFYSRKRRDFSIILEEFKQIKDNYFHSLDAYLEGFSFDKIKTSSVIYFQEISDKIHDAIRKVSSYLFAIPVSFLFLASRLDFEAPSLAKNFMLLVLGYLFFILLRKIFFKNIKESLDSIDKEIVRFQAKIENVSELNEIKNELEKDIKGELLSNQYEKLKLLKRITCSIIVALTVVVFYIHWSVLEKSIISLCETIIIFF
ncbi:hypothetical protein SAMN04487911_10894 [Arenibacter nanhaiticus]|uniref:Uncharacterized protein n=1 Tax=Arenibacter nanhaiticus TaxID=558155 RepID=A0A1M6FDW4_9FLAO|nr:hypothetical protein [Arenibacter nanhaiticus]SHI95836.1 hypothetical protein SAMN04487911_10894 [Arenibacter nanhaiticus]